MDIPYIDYEAIQGQRLLRSLRSLAMTVLIAVLSIFFSSFPIFASEVLEQTQTRVIVREHPKTGKPYVSIVPGEGPIPEDPFVKQRQTMRRPDYRLLDPKIKSGEIPYEGPYSSSKKIYIFAATLATLGAASFAGAALLPIASSGVAASGGATYLAGGGAVAAGAAAGTVALQKNDPKKDDFTQTSKAQTEEEQPLSHQ